MGTVVTGAVATGTVSPGTVSTGTVSAGGVTGGGADTTADIGGVADDVAGARGTGVLRPGCRIWGSNCGRSCGSNCGRIGAVTGNGAGATGAGATGAGATGAGATGAGAWACGTSIAAGAGAAGAGGGAIAGVTKTVRGASCTTGNGFAMVSGAVGTDAWLLDTTAFSPGSAR